MTPTKKAAAATPPRGTAPGSSEKAAAVTSDDSTTGHGIAGPDAQPQVSPSRATSGKDGGPGASDAPAAPPVTVTEPGVYDGMPDEVYHGDPVPSGSLSSSGARLLLPPSCPAKFAWERDNGRAPKRAWDVGHAAHRRVLGVGAELVVVQTGTKDGPTGPAQDYKTKYAQEHRDEIRAAGAVPVLQAELDAVDGMAAAIRVHPIASVLFDPELGGLPEQSLFWLDPAFDVWRRARLDWLPAVTPDGRLIVPDYKSCTSAEPSSIERSVASFGYHQQDDWYRDALRALGLAEDPAFVFVFQEKSPPYLITVVELDAPSRRIGRRRNLQALDVFTECTATGYWPGYVDDVALVSLPRWELTRNGEAA